MTSVVILSHERPRLLRQCIESLYANTSQDQFTCTVVEDSSLDFKVGKYLRSLIRKNLTVLEVKNSGHVISQLKNLGVFYSRQRFGTPEWLHIGDSDTAFLPGWLERLTAVAEVSEGSGFRLWGGQVHPFHKPLTDEVFLYKHQTVPDYTPRWTEHSVLDGPSWLMRWDTWDLCGPLDRTTASGACQSEEYGFCEHLLRIGIVKVERESSGLEVTVYKGGRIGVISPHVVVHTGLTQTNGAPAPGAAERRLLIPEGVLAE